MSEQECGPARGNWVVSGLVLVVLGLVIGAVVFPAMTRTREGTPVPPCQRNMRELAIALQTYWNDYDGHLPSSAVVSGSRKWDRRDFVTFATKLGSLPPPAHPRTYPQALYTSMKNKDVMFCPRDDADRGDPNARTSYWWKLAIDKAWYGDHCTKPCRKDTDFAYNADQIVLYERCGFHCNAKEGLRNGVLILAAYLDSHVKTISITNSLPANGKRWVTSPTALGEPAYFNYDNKTNTRMNPNTLANHVDPARFSDSL